SRRPRHRGRCWDTGASDRVERVSLLRFEPSYEPCLISLAGVVLSIRRMYEPDFPHSGVPKGSGGNVVGIGTGGAGSDVAAGGAGSSKDCAAALSSTGLDTGARTTGG